MLGWIGLLTPACAQPAPPAEKPIPLQVGAWYFTAWHAGNQIHTLSSLSTYGRQDVWGGIRDHAQGKNPFHWNEAKGTYASRLPALGFYDQMQPGVIQQHLKWAKAHGLDFFGVYWYWNSVSHGPDPINGPLEVLSKVNQSQKFPIFLAPFVLGGVSLQEWKTQVVPAFVKAALGQQYYTVQKRPLVAVLYPGLQNSEIKAGMDSLRTAMQKAFGQDPILLWTLFDDAVKPADLQFLDQNAGIDGFTCLHFPPHGPGEPYPTTLKRWQSSTEQLAPYAHMPCISTGFDPRPWFKVGTDPLGNYNTGVSVKAFENFLPQVRTYLEKHSEQTQGHVIVYAFNEWGEGGIIEPSKVLGTAYLDALKKQLTGPLH